VAANLEGRSLPKAAVQSSSAHRIGERRFYLSFAVALVVAVFLGFARTFFLRAWFPEWAAAHGAPEAIFYVHGMAFAAWYLLLVAQASLITMRRTAWHRRIGVASAGLAVAIVALGVAASLTAARRRTGFFDVPLPPLQFLVVPILIIALYSVFVTLAFIARQTPQAHKRYILLASVVMVEAAVGRWPFGFMRAMSPVPYLEMPSLVTDLFLLPMLAWDLRSRGQVHPVTQWGGLAILSSHLSRGLIAQTAVWLALAEWAVHLLGP